MRKLLLLAPLALAACQNPYGGVDYGRTALLGAGAAAAALGAAAIVDQPARHHGGYGYGGGYRGYGYVPGYVPQGNPYGWGFRY